MGLTIQYALRAPDVSSRNVVGLARRMRSLALDLPFEYVGDIVDVRGRSCDFETRRQELQGHDNAKEELFWMLIQSAGRVGCPWNKRVSWSVTPQRVVGFTAWPGPGCEHANFGLCTYPKAVDWDYDPKDDRRFQSVTEKKFGWYHFDWRKWERHCRRRYGCVKLPEQFRETRQVPTRLAGWSWRSFCKTQYASNPACGGIPHFLRCHITVITLLERLRKLPELRVHIHDEGSYGPSSYREEPSVENGKPRYRRHRGRHSPSLLAKEVGDWNAAIAGFSGALKDALGSSGVELQSEIAAFSNFEQLEFKGSRQKQLGPFLAAMKALAHGIQAAAVTTEPSD